ncbi:MAG: hypothetical protein HY554_05410 [Elusimicrobia bacterium]|nr:hypothetical protein [Elusimicrobiota bacterium]
MNARSARARALVASLAAAALLARQAWSQERGRLGLGVIAGDPTGATGKLWLGETRALDFGVGFSGDAAFYGDFVAHDWTLLPQPPKGRLAATLSAGPRLETHRDLAVGIRTLAGLDWLLESRPIELFFEVGPVFVLKPDRGLDVDVGLGVRIGLGGK